MNRKNFQSLVEQPRQITGYEPFQYEGLSYEIGWQLYTRNYIARDMSTKKLVNILIFTPDEISYNNVVSRFDLYSTIRQSSCFKRSDINKYLVAPISWGIITQGSADLTMFTTATTDNRSNEDLTLYPQIAFVVLPYLYTDEVDVKQIAQTSLPLFLYQMLSLLDNLQKCGYGLSALDLTSITFDFITTSYIVVNTEYVTQFSQGQVVTNIDTFNNIYKEITGTSLLTGMTPLSLPYSYSELKRNVINQYFLNMKQPLIQKDGNELIFFYPDKNVTIVYSLTSKQFLSVIDQNIQKQFNIPNTITLLPEINQLYRNYQNTFKTRLSPTTSIKNLYILQQLYQAYFSNDYNIKQQACDALNLYKIVACPSPQPISLNAIPWLTSYPEILIELYWKISSTLP
jgi:hypothetical protein